LAIRARPSNMDIIISSRGCGRQKRSLFDAAQIGANCFEQMAVERDTMKFLLRWGNVCMQMNFMRSRGQDSPSSREIGRAETRQRKSAVTRQVLGAIVKSKERTSKISDSAGTLFRNLMFCPKPGGIGVSVFDV
jgi:hypothetical protein